MTTPSSVRNWRGVLTRVALMSFSVLVSLAIGEAILALLAPVPDPFEYLKSPSRNSFIRTERAPLDTYNIRVLERLPGVKPTATVGTNNRGYRGPTMQEPKPEGEYRILLVGGSTTENRILDDSETLSTVLEAELRGVTGRSGIRVYSAGVAGHRSDDNVSMVAHRIVHQEPDLVVVFAGINDLLAAMRDMDYQHYGADYTDRTPHLSRYMLIKMLATEWQIPRRLVYLVRNLRGEPGLRVDDTVTTDYAGAVTRLRAAPVAAERPRTDVESFVTNLRSIVGIARAQDFDVVLMTQYTTWNSATDSAASAWHWMRYVDGVTFPEDWMDDAMEEYNEATRELALAQGVPLFDLAALWEKSSRYVFDDVHFNTEGARATGVALAEFLAERIVGLR